MQTWSPRASWPIAAGSEQPSCGGSGARSGVPATSRIWSPTATRISRLRPATATVRARGPCRSKTTRQGRPVMYAARRTAAAMRVQSSGPSWAQLMRARSAPRRTSSHMKAASDAACAGSVTMIRTSRPGGAGPNAASVCRRRSRLPRKKTAGRGCRAADAQLPGFTIGASEAITASRFASTLPSQRPSEDSPSGISVCCSRRRSCRRSAM
jgi:hypothetical protein